MNHWHRGLISNSFLNDEGQPLLDDAARERQPTRAARRHHQQLCWHVIALPLLVTLLLSRRSSLLRSDQDLLLSEVLSGLDQFHQPEQSTAPKVKSGPGFASYLDYNYAGDKGQPIDVTYDGRSFMLNSERTIFLSGSMHPVRATRATWSLALDEAVRNGLNMITIYVMWSAHQPFENQTIQWDLPMTPLQCTPDKDIPCDWTLASALWAAAERGLFVHLRLGPYVCAEYSYGGIPEWLPLKYPLMDMRRLHPQWMNAMREFLAAAVQYLRDNQLFASQGGPILFAQIENELGDDGSVDVKSAHYGSLQQYADWCGELAQELAPNVVWTMCNGLSAKNTINTFNGDFAGPSWLEKRGDTGRIQMDQPAMWTEDEEGFQIWGEEPSNPTDYYWGRTARGMAYSALQWFARGGTHLNYYMFWGGQNFGRMAAAGITNNYASDAVLCSSGQRHEPKYAHFQTLHKQLASVAQILVQCESALFKSEKVTILSPSGTWIDGVDQLMFRYMSCRELKTEVIFAENNADETVTVRVPSVLGDIVTRMQPVSAILLIDGMISFDSASISVDALRYKRTFGETVDVVSCTAKVERVGAPTSSHRSVRAPFPLEQTYLMANMSLSSDYAWYETSFNVTSTIPSASLFIDTAQANAMLVYLDGELVGANDTHNHKEGNATLSLSLGTLFPRVHSLSILSESLGYGNLLGRWGATTRSKLKGIVNNVWITSPSLPSRMNLVDGRDWWSHPGLHGEHSDLVTAVSASHGGMWSLAKFVAPNYDPSRGLFLEMTLGRGHIYLNGRDVGRFWNVTRGASDEPSQRHYFLPPDLIYPDGQINELRWFDAFGSKCEGYRLLLSWIEQGGASNGFQDDVSYPMACI